MADFPTDVDLVKPVLEEADKFISGVVGQQTSVTTDIESRSHNPHPLIPIKNEHVVLDGLEFFDRLPLPKGWSIFKVPSHIRDVNEQGYEPKIVSVGPFHYKRPGLEHMEAQKLRILRKYETDALVEIKEAMEKLEDETRDCYSEEFKDIDNESFRTMMLVDGCFVVYLLRLAGESNKGKLADDPIFATQWMPLNIGRDLLLLENQLPLIVLEKIFDLTTSYWPDEGTISLSELAVQFFQPLRPGRDEVPSNGSLFNEKTRVVKRYPHLLSLFQSSCAPIDQNIVNPHNRNKGKKLPTTTIVSPGKAFTGKGWTYGAHWLSRARLKFKNSSGNVLDIEYKKRTLQIPTLYLDGNTVSVLRNLVAYEQCDLGAEPYFTCYAFFFANILGNVEDVTILKKSGIIRSGHGVDKEQVVIFFNNLAKELVFDMNKCCLTNVIEDIQTYSQSITAKGIFVFRAVIPRIKLMELVLVFVSLLQFVYFMRSA